MIDSLQGLCYADGLKMINCKLMSTSLAFEYSTVDVTVDGRVESIFNPSAGKIKADCIGDLIIERDRIDPEMTKIESGIIEKESDRPEWLN